MILFRFKQLSVMGLILMGIAFFNTKIFYASTIKPENFPVQEELVIGSEKDIPRLAWTAGKYLQAGRFQDAADLSEKLLDVAADNIKAAAYLAAAYKGLGDQKNYEIESGKFKKKHPTSPDLFLALAWTYSALGEPENAENICKQGVELFPSSEILQMELAGILLKQGKNDAAKNRYADLLQRKTLPTKLFLNASFALCRIGLVQKDFDLVIKHATRLINSYPLIPQSYKFLAGACIGKSEYEHAVDAYKDLIKANPESELPYQELALLYNDQIKDHGQALFYAEEGLKKFPAHPKTMDILGWVFFTNREYSKALEKFLAAIKISDITPLFYYHAGMAYQKIGNNHKAFENYKKAYILLGDADSSAFRLELKNRMTVCK